MRRKRNLCGGILEYYRVIAIAVSVSAQGAYTASDALNFLLLLEITIEPI